MKPEKYSGNIFVLLLILFGFYYVGHLAGEMGSNWSTFNFWILQVAVFILFFLGIVVGVSYKITKTE